MSIVATMGESVFTLRKSVPRKARYLTALATVLLMTACDGEDQPVSTADSSVADSGFKTVGNFQCSAGHPHSQIQINASADVPPGGTSRLTVETPPGTQIPPGNLMLYCQADQNWCSGTSCGSTPPVDFIGPHADGLTWESIRSEAGDMTTKYTAIAHNSDLAAPHHVVLTLDMSPRAVGILPH